MGLEKGLELGLDTLCKTLDSASPPPEKLELVLLTRSATGEGLVLRELTLDEVRAELKKKEEREKKKAA